MKKYIITLFAALSLFLSPMTVHAQEADKVETEIRAEYVEDWTPDKSVVTIIQSETDKSIELDSATYNEYKQKGYNVHKIFNNKLIKDADSNGMGVTLMSMCIVLFALIVLSLLFLFFGKMFAKSHNRKKIMAQGVPPTEADDSHDSGEVIAAIGMALDEYFNAKHDMEDTVLTIRRMKRAYSPWNSKIYNMREVPVLRHNKR